MTTKAKRTTGTRAVGTAFADRMKRPFMTCALRIDGDSRRRTFFANEVSAAGEAEARIKKLAAEQKRGTFAIVKIIRIVEPVSPTIASRAPREEDEYQPIERFFGDSHPAMSRCIIGSQMDFVRRLDLGDILDKKVKALSRKKRPEKKVARKRRKKS